jgi:hypothetical protein
MRRIVALIILLPVYALVLSSCRQKAANDNNLVTLNESLERSISVLHTDIAVILETTEQNLFNPMFGDRLKNWYAEARVLHTGFNSVHGYIRILKESLQKEKELADSSIENLYQKLIVINNLSPTTDSSLSENSNAKKFYFSSKFDSILSTGQEKFEKDFQDNSSSEKNIMLSYFELELRLAERKMMEFGYYKSSPGCRLSFNINTPMLFYKSSIVKPGERVEIIAGVGYFAKNAKPEISIGGKKVHINSSGYSETSFTAPNVPGNYKVPVMIKYIDEDGKEQLVQQDTEYRVEKTCQ